MKTRMVLAISSKGIGITYKCFHLPDYGKRCDDRDDGSHCMQCKYCKAEMSAFDATRMLNKFGGKNG